MPTRGLGVNPFRRARQPGTVRDLGGHDMARTRKKKTAGSAGPYTLAIDIGGTGLKALVMDARGKPVHERVRLETPRPATPTAVMRVLRALVAKQPKFDRVSVGFPGVVFDGVIATAPNLDGKWGG